jgi:hypothetical protein
LALAPRSLPRVARERWRELELRALTGLAARLDSLTLERGLAPTDRAADAPLVAASDLLGLAVTGAATALTPVEEQEPSLRLRFQSLLDASLEPRDETETDAHPSFGWIVTQLVPDEALIVSLFAKRGHMPLLEVQAGTLLGRDGKTVAEHVSAIGETVGARHPEHVPAYIDNLCRLGLLRIAKPDPADRDLHELLEASPECEEIRKRIAGEMKLTPKLRRRQARLTAFGRLFCDACSA